MRVPVNGTHDGVVVRCLDCAGSASVLVVQGEAPPTTLLASVRAIMPFFSEVFLPEQQGTAAVDAITASAAEEES